jgi:hypothetical protein
MFLTDGEPTAGVTTPSVILSNVRQALGYRVALFSLAFGDDADFPMQRCAEVRSPFEVHF